MLVPVGLLGVLQALFQMVENIIDMVSVLTELLVWWRAMMSAEVQKVGWESGFGSTEWFHSCLLLVEVAF